MEPPPLKSDRDELLNALRYYSALWELAPGGVLRGNPSNCVAVKRRDGSPAVLKIHRFPILGFSEIRALMHWQGRGVPRILQADLANGVVLLERILPGRPVDASTDLSPERLASLLTRLYAPPFHGGSTIPTLADNVRLKLDWHRYALRQAGYPERTPRLRKMHRRALALCASATRQVLLHGDFLEKNLLVGPGGSLVVMDPLPCLGDISFDTALIACTNRTGIAVHEFVERMCGIVGCDVRRTLAWTTALQHPWDNMET